MFFSAIGMKAPGFARAAPAPMTATAGDDATFPILSTALATLAGSAGRRKAHTTQTRGERARVTARTATQVFGELGVSDAAAFPSTKAAMTPIPSVAVNAPR